MWFPGRRVPCFDTLGLLLLLLSTCVYTQAHPSFEPRSPYSRLFFLAAMIV